MAASPGAMGAEARCQTGDKTGEFDNLSNTDPGSMGTPDTPAGDSTGDKTVTGYDRLRGLGALEGLEGLEGWALALALVPTCPNYHHEHGGFRCSRSKLPLRYERWERLERQPFTFIYDADGQPCDV